jgi:hypothetical protein
MSDAANATSLASSRLLQECLLQEYAVTWARRAINLKVVPHSDDDLWSFVMLPNAQPMSTLFLSPLGSCFAFFIHPDNLCLQLLTVHATRSDPLTPRSQASGRAAQQREREWAALAKERRRQELLEKYNEEYRLCE